MLKMAAHYQLAPFDTTPCLTSICNPVQQPRRRFRYVESIPNQGINLLLPGFGVRQRRMVDSNLPNAVDESPPGRQFPASPRGIEIGCFRNGRVAQLAEQLTLNQ